MKKVYLILHYLSKANTYLLCFLILFLIQNYTIGFILNIFIRKEYCYLFFIINSITFIKSHIKISSPHKKYIN